MINLHDRIAADPDYHICRIFLQFEQHGAIINYDAYILEDLGYLRSTEHRLDQIEDPITIYKMTFKGRKQSLKFRRDWINKYVPKYDLKSDDIPDSYQLKGAGDHLWAFSLVRLHNETEEGFLDLVIARAM